MSNVVRRSFRGLVELFTTAKAVGTSVLFPALRPTWGILFSDGPLLLGQFRPNEGVIRCFAVSDREDVRRNSVPFEPHLARVRGVFPRHRLTYKHLKLPTQDPSEAAAMLGYEIPDLVPYEADEVIYDYYLVEANEPGYTEACALIGQLEPILEHVHRALALRLFPERLMPSSSAFANWLLHYRGASFQTPEALVVVSSDFLEVLVVALDRILFSRSIPLQSDSSGFHETVVTEVARSLTLYSGSDVFVDLSGINILCDMPELRTRLKDMVTTYHAPIPLPTSDASEQLLLGYTFEGEESLPPSKRALLLGALLPLKGNPAVFLNLMPLRVLGERRRRRTWGRLAANTAILLLNLFLVGLLLSSAAHVKESELSALEQRRRDLGPVAAEISKKRDQMNLMKQAVQRQERSLMLLAELHRITPTEVAISRLTVDENGHVRLEGQASELSHVFAFMGILRGSARFDAVNYVRGGTTTVSGRKYVRFVLEMHCR